MKKTIKRGHQSKSHGWISFAVTGESRHDRGFGWRGTECRAVAHAPQNAHEKERAVHDISEAMPLTTDWNDE